MSYSGPHNEIRRRKLVARAYAGAVVMLLAVFGLTFSPSGEPASAAETITQCNAVANTGGLGVECHVTVVNDLNVSTGVESSTVTVTECHGAANTDPTCVAATTSYPELTTVVNQCNDAANGGGASVICDVKVVNNLTAAALTDIAPFTTASVNQCVGSGAEGTEPTLLCDPAPASVTSATITQCNGSANGGGAAIRVTCSVTPSVMSAQLPVTINQCNGTANGGGSVVTCTASLTSLARVAVAPTPTSTPTPTPTATSVPTSTPTPTPTRAQRQLRVAPERAVAQPPAARAPTAPKAARVPTPTPALAPLEQNTLHDSHTDGVRPDPSDGAVSIIELLFLTEQPGR